MKTISDEIRFRIANHGCSIPPLVKKVDEIITWDELIQLLDEFKKLEKSKERINQVILDVVTKEQYHESILGTPSCPTEVLG